MQLETIVLGTDFSDAATRTARWVATRMAPNASLILVHALEPNTPPAFLVGAGLVTEGRDSGTRGQCEDQLREFALSLGRNGVRTEVRVGRAHDVMSEVATQSHAQLIAVGPHGNRAHRSLLLGTTADSLVRSAKVPVLIGPRARISGKTRVLAALTDSSARKQVIAWAAFVATKLSGRVTVLHALEPAAYSHAASLAAAHAHGDESLERGEIDVMMRQLARHWLEESVASGIDRSIIDLAVEVGDAAEVILSYAAKRGPALIVLGRHEVARGLPVRLGRTVRHVLHASRCGVLIVPIS
jgi:nucleotide-binding universal stress UspA family protein